MRSDFYLKTYSDTSPNDKKNVPSDVDRQGYGRQCLMLIDGGLDQRRDCGAL